MKLIDANALADALFDKRKNYPLWVADTIGKMPDAVVRCKDCRKGTVLDECYVNCNLYKAIHAPMFYCASGERRID